eukprot:7007079-Prymnesium_polylepis.1
MAVGLRHLETITEKTTEKIVTKPRKTLQGFSSEDDDHAKTGEGKAQRKRRRTYDSTADSTD